MPAEVQRDIGTGNMRLALRVRIDLHNGHRLGGDQQRQRASVEIVTDLERDLDGFAKGRRREDGNAR